MSVNRILTLSNGEKLGSLEIGNPDGEVCLFFHGFPGSSKQVFLIHDHQVLQQLRLIAIDRPGFGDSSLPKKRALEDMAENIRELTDHLKIEKFHLMAVSGGSPWMFVVADRLRDRVKSVTSLCGLGPLHEKECFQSMPKAGQVFLMMARRSTFFATQALARVYAKLQEDKRPNRASLEKWISSGDVDLIMDEKIRSVFRQSMGHAFKQGAKGPATEVAIIQDDWKIKDWNFPFPVRFWHGLDDRIVPPEHSRILAKRIPNAELHLLPNEGHYTVPIRRLDDVIKGLFR